MPVSAYKGIAEKYGFVLVGSNVSKNGVPWPVNNDAVKVMMDDTRWRLYVRNGFTPVDFRADRGWQACSHNGWRGGGVIGCAAGFPNVEGAPQSKFDYFGMVGDDD